MTRFLYKSTVFRSIIGCASNQYCSDELKKKVAEPCIDGTGRLEEIIDFFKGSCTFSPKDVFEMISIHSTQFYLFILLSFICFQYLLLAMSTPVDSSGRRSKARAFTLYLRFLLSLPALFWVFRCSRRQPTRDAAAVVVVTVDVKRGTAAASSVCMCLKRERGGGRKGCGRRRWSRRRRRRRKRRRRKVSLSMMLLLKTGLQTTSDNKGLRCRLASICGPGNNNRPLFYKNGSQTTLTALTERTHAERVEEEDTDTNNRLSCSLNTNDFTLATTTNLQQQQKQLFRRWCDRS